jgi:Domain of unknown function (DUF4203)
MLPVTLQIPAAIVLVLGGAVACFAGYRFFRVVLGIYGFVLGALLATTIAGASSTSSLVLWAVVGGIAGALALNFAYFFGVVLVGAAVGAMAVTAIWSRASGDPHVLVVIAFAAAGALAAMWLQRYVVITGTAFGGAWTLLVGVLALMGDAAAKAAAAANNVWVVYPLDPAPGRRWLPLVWLVLGLAGMFVQLRRPAPAVKRARRAGK